MASCADDNLYSSDKGNIDGGNKREMTLEVGVNALSASLRTRATESDVNSLWLGVYDVTTGERVGYNFVNSPNASGNPVQIVYFDSHPTVVVVGVANYDNFTGLTTDDTGNETENSLANILEAADTWSKFRDINVTVNPKGDDEDILMMGYVSTSKFNNPTIGLNGESGVVVNGSTGNSDNSYIIDLFDGANLDDKNFEIAMKKEVGTLHLVPLISTINVKVKAGDNVEVSDIQYRVLNMPKTVYLAERPMCKDDVAHWNTWIINSPNHADAILPEKSNNIDKTGSYYDDSTNEGEESWKTATNNEFSFKHYENKHWGIENKLSTQNDREAKYPNTSLYKGLCRNELTELNNFASYFIIKLKVYDKNNETSALVEYTIHEGYCNNEYGEKQDKNLVDFSCFRNMTYNYTININGLKNLLVNVNTETEHNDGISGDSWTIDDKEASNDNSFELTLPYQNSSNETLDRSKWLFRFYVGPGYSTDNQALDYISDVETAKGLNGLYWPTIGTTVDANNSSINEFFSFEVGNQTFDNISSFLEYIKGSGISETSVKVKFTKTYDEEDLPENPAEYAIIAYLFHPDESEIKYDSDNCTSVLGKIYRCYYQPEEKEKLPAPTAKPFTFTTNFLTASFELEFDSLDAQYSSNDYEYKLVIENKYEYTFSGTKQTVPSYQLRGDRNTNYTLQAISKSNQFADSEVATGGTIKLAENKDWSFNKSNWKSVISAITSKESHTDRYDNLYVIEGSGNFNSSQYNETLGSSFFKSYGTGDKTKQTFKFTVQKSCRVKVWISNDKVEPDKPKYVNIIYKKTGDSNDTKLISDPIEYSNYGTNNYVDFDLNSILEGTDVYLHSSGGGLKFYRIELVEIPENK